MEESGVFQNFNISCITQWWKGVFQEPSPLRCQVTSGVELGLDSLVIDIIELSPSFPSALSIL